MRKNRKRLAKGRFSESEWQNLFLKASKDTHCILLDSHHHEDRYSKYEKILAWGKLETFELSKHQTLESLFQWHRSQADWIFGHLNYELKSLSEGLKNPEKDPLEWPLAAFFRPKNLLIKTKNDPDWYFESSEYDSLQELLEEQELHRSLSPNLKYQALISREQYLQDVRDLKQEIQLGNIYEINYCQCFEAQGKIDPPALFLQKNREHQVPFATYYRQESKHALCFSPERYLRKIEQKVISQPIKGTAPRKAEAAADQKAREALLESEKERAENVMIVDLVRNDLSRTAAKNSVQVEELFGLYSFNAVHQMISTISSQLDAEKHSWADLIAMSFPMGSMTGAPKYNAMRLSDQHEHFNRGLYSGSIGYIDPKGDFDFNVVIRSILYHDQKELARIAVGGAITTHCSPEAEYEECLLKAEKLFG